jgi:hypothetical protein
MKLTESILKQLILEQMSEFELSEFIHYFEQLQTFLPSGHGIQVDLGRRDGQKATKPQGINSLSATEDSFQAAIDSLAREIEGNATEAEWDYVTIEKDFRTQRLGLEGDISCLLVVERSGRKSFYLTQWREWDEDEIQYYQGNEISINALANFMASTDEDMFEYAQHHLNTYGEKTQRSETL